MRHAVAGVVLGGPNGRLDAIDECEWRRAGMLPVRRRFVGDHENVLTGGGLAVPAVRQVEQPTADNNDGEVS
jgi:hypothetical protein